MSGEQGHLLTSAALPSQQKQKKDWRPLVQQLLLLLIVAMTLPRVMWTSLHLADDLFEGHGWRALSLPLSVIGLLASVVVAVVIGNLKVLDQTDEGRTSAPLRHAAFVALIVDTCWDLSRRVLLNFVDISTIFSNFFLSFFAFQLVSFVADFLVALWLARLLKEQKKEAFLPAIVIGSTAIYAFSHFFGLGPWMSSVVQLIIIFSTAFELMRVRKVLS